MTNWAVRQGEPFSPPPCGARGHSAVFLLRLLGWNNLWRVQDGLDGQKVRAHVQTCRLGDSRILVDRGDLPLGGLTLGAAVGLLLGGDAQAGDCFHPVHCGLPLAGCGEGKSCQLPTGS